MSQLVTVDPITRIEGHLRIQVEVENGRVKDAWTSGTLFRGLETILQGRKAEDAWLITQRACGVCPINHGLASTMSVESAYGVKVPDNAILIRNLLLGLQFLNSHILHFYHLTALDYVDVTSVAKYKGNDATLNDVKSLIASGDTAPFTPRYGVDFRLPAEINITAVAHYVEALRIYRRANEAFALIGAKFPHMMTAVPGGVTVKITSDMISQIMGYVKEIQDFVETKYIPDVLAVAGYYKDYGNIGVGVKNYLAWGAFADLKGNTLFPSGVIFNADLSNIQEADPTKVTEEVTHSWYKDTTNGLTPDKGATEPDFTGFNERAADGTKYSWLKAPRYEGRPMEVGPLARMLVRKDEGLLGIAKQLGIGPSVLARHAARALEAKLIAEAMYEWLGQLDPEKPTYEAYKPVAAVGAGLTEAPRGALGHWINTDKQGNITNYQMVVPTTWNAGPRDEKGIRGPMEEALVGTPVANLEQPVELVRVVRSFDPCLACAVHVIDVENPDKVRKFQIA